MREISGKRGEGLIHVLGQANILDETLGAVFVATKLDRHDDLKCFVSQTHKEILKSFDKGSR